MYTPDATLTSVRGGCEDAKSPFLLVSVIFMSVVLHIRGRSHHRFKAVRPTSGSVIISDVIYSRNVQQAVEEGRLLNCETCESTPAIRADWQGSRFSVDNFFFFLFCFLRFLSSHFFFVPFAYISKLDMYRHIQAFSLALPLVDGLSKNCGRMRNV